MKRGIDIVFSIIGIILLSPLFVISAIAIKLDSKGTILFRQERSGKDFMPFKIYKFRTMVSENEHSY
ncbi:MAG: sugar transferase [Candidatus Kuenenia sp.]|nr:sugar transferase [Candidatus Kuenenia hertensis]